MQAGPQTRRTITRRGAFSLVELLIVIVIIAILLGLLLAGVNGAMKRARVVACTTEISNLSKAIADFKLEYGVEPPSFIVLYESGGNASDGYDPSWGTDTGASSGFRNISRSQARSIFANLDFDFYGEPPAADNQTDINQDGDGNDYFILNGAECLVFFLGGVCERVDLDGDGDLDFVPSGFSANAANPFAIGGTRVGPFYQFDPARLIDTDGDGMPEYLDNLPGQEIMPLQYFSSYEGTGYRPRGIDGVYDNSATSDDECLPGGLLSHYILANTAAANADPLPTSPNTSWNSSGFQIISPGFDGEFGSGGVYTQDGQLPVHTNSTGPREPALERDNITNFKGGTLN